MRKVIVAIVILILVVAAGWGGYAKYKAGKDQANTLTVRFEPAEMGKLVETISAPGKIEPEDKVSISARVVARIIQLPHKEGDIVTKGDPTANPPIPPSVLVVLDSNDLAAQLRATEARFNAQKSQIAVSQDRINAQDSQIEGVQVQLTEAKRDLKRQMELLASKDVSQSTVDTAQAKVDQLEAQLETTKQQQGADRRNLEVLRHQLDAADAEIAQARDNLSYTTITSPINGVVTRLNAEVGELVMTGTMNNPGTVIMEVADLERMMMVARVDEAAVAQVKKGQKAIVHAQAYPGEEFEGTVQTVALAITEEVTMGNAAPYYETEILLNSDGTRIFSGLTADADIATQTHENVLKVPSQAVLARKVDELPDDIRRGPDVDLTKSFATVVYRVVDGKTVVTPVKVGASDITHTIVKEGLKSGDMIVTGPYKVLESLTHDQVVKQETPTTQPAEKK